MASEEVTVRIDGRDANDRLRDAVLRLGGLLAWEPCDVMAFAEGLTGCPWDRCGAVEFALVLDEYQMLVRAIEAKRARRAARVLDYESATVEGAADVGPA
jgi:hypothetical protein